MLRDIEGGGLLGYWSKGHHPPTDFAAAVEKEHGNVITAEEVRHGWRRMAIGQFDGEWRHWLCPAAAGSRGAFPVTIVEED